MLGKKIAFLDHCTFSLFLAEKSHYGTNHHQENADHAGLGGIADIVAFVAQVFHATLIFASCTFCCLAILQEAGVSGVA